MDRRQQAAAERYRETAQDRRKLQRRHKAEGTWVMDTPIYRTSTTEVTSSFALILFGHEGFADSLAVILSGEFL